MHQKLTNSSSERFEKRSMKAWKTGSPGASYTMRDDNLPLPQ